jgi:hypothetical protein
MRAIRGTRVHVMSPFAQVLVYDRAPIERTVSVWACLSS